MKMQKKKRTIFFGAGKTAVQVWDHILSREYAEDVCDDILFCDNNPELWGTIFRGRPIICPHDIEQYNIEYVVITSIYINEISKQLVTELNVSEDKIITWREYVEIQFAKQAYKKQYGTDYRKSDMNVFLEDKLVVYTAIIGDYDELKNPEYICPDITYVCFTDNKKIKSDVWNIEYITSDGWDNRILARKIKMTPQDYFKDFDTSVWIDGKGQIKDDLRKYIARYGGKESMLCFPHYARKCVYEEQAGCIMGEKDEIKKIVRQASEYYMQGYPFDNGLYETACIVRKHNTDICVRLMEEWFEEVKKHSNRDQISLPYICWKNSFLPDICDLNIKDNPWIEIKKHKRG